MLQPRLSHVCDACKARKVKCQRSAGPGSACTNCCKKGESCVYSPSKRKFRRRNAGISRQVPDTPLSNHGPEVDSPSPCQSYAGNEGLNTPENNDRPVSSLGSLNNNEDTTSGSLYVDQLLDTRQSTGRTQHPSFLLGANEDYLASSSLSFFSDSRLNALSTRLGDDALKHLIKHMSVMIRSRVETMNRSRGPSGIWEKSDDPPDISPEKARHFINAYFEHVHPLYPFLDRSEFEHRAYNNDLAANSPSQTSWSALYHTILALGCEFDGGGSFAPGPGEAWKLFRVALSLYPKVLLMNTDLMEVQAILAMTVFCQNISGMQIFGKIISEAARVAQRALLNKGFTSSDAAARSRTFWVIYYIEKTATFCHGTTSIIMDCDIGTPVPDIPESIFGDFDWFLASIKLARLYSKVFTELFSISATKNSSSAYLSNIDLMEKLLEQQRLAIPTRFRPGEKLSPQQFSKPCEIAAALRIHYHYHELRIALNRLKLHITRDLASQDTAGALTNMMSSAQTIIELTRLIPIEPFTPSFLLVLTPITALFVLFDLAIHNPGHSETQNNLTLLESVTGHFSALEYATRGYLPSSMLVKFATIARTFVRRCFSAEGGSDSQHSISADHAQADTRTSDLTIPQVSLDGDSGLLAEANVLYPDFVNFSADLFSLDNGVNIPGLDVMELFGTAVPNLEFFPH